MKEFIISEELINKVLKYLQGRPFIEVYQIINEFQTSIKPVIKNNGIPSEGTLEKIYRDETKNEVSEPEVLYGDISNSETTSANKNDTSQNDKPEYDEYDGMK